MGGDNFGWAIQQLKDGKRVRRMAWTEGVWIVILSQKRNPITGQISMPQIAQQIGDIRWQPGWSPGQESMLANDWILNPTQPERDS